MNDKVLEGMIRTVLGDYRDRLAKSKVEVDFSLDFNESAINPYQVAKSNGVNVSELEDQGEIKVTYFRIIKVVKGQDPRVVFANYVNVEVSKKPAIRKERLMREAIKHFMLGGLEYAEALYTMQKNQKAQQEKIEKPEMKVSKAKAKPKAKKKAEVK